MERSEAGLRNDNIPTNLKNQLRDSLKSDFNNDGIYDLCYRTSNGEKIICRFGTKLSNYVESFNIDYPELEGYDVFEINSIKNNAGGKGIKFHYFNSSSVGFIDLHIFFDTSKGWYLTDGIKYNPIRMDYDSKIERCTTTFNLDIKKIPDLIDELGDKIIAESKNCQAQYKISRSFEEILSFYKTETKNEITSRGSDIERLKAYLNKYPLNKLNVSSYNDIGYYLEQSSAFREASFILEEIIKDFPERIVAYINLGDAYWGLKDTPKAKAAYQKYIDLMKQSGKEAKIPKRVLERIK